MIKIVKRNGAIVDFDKSKIENAILRAMKYGSGIVDEMAAKEISKEIECKLKDNGETSTIYQIEDMVYHSLIEYDQELTAKAYEGYRAVQAYKRENDPLIDSVMGLVDLTNKEVMLENSNKQAELAATQRDLIAGEISKTISKNYLIPAHLVQANDNGLIKIHDLDYFLNGIYNCFDKDTRIITDLGTFSFGELGEGKVVKVPTHTGEWKKAIVKSYGNQDLYKLTFKRQNGMQKEVLCTNDHRWILDNGDVTTDIKIGDKLQETPIIESFNINNMTNEERLSWIQGFVIGDGTEYNHNSSNGCQVRLCGNKNKYRNIFDMSGYNYFKIKDSDDVQYTLPSMRKQSFLDNKEYRNLTKNQKIALINGLYSADASLYKGNFKMITSIDKRILEMVRELSEAAGYYLNGEFVVEGATNYSPNGRKPLTYIQFNKKQYRIKWKLIDKQYVKNDTAWCLEVEDNHSFILSNGMVTGNCELINLEDMLQNGTVINKKKIRKPKSLRTAMTIATQISAQVSSNTYGGQTMSLTHLAPFVRISKEKIINKYINLKAILGDIEFNKLVDTELKSEIKDSVQTFNYQINTISSTNGQTPFISLAMYLSENEEYKEETAMLIEEFLKQRIEGMENEHGIKTTQTFPKLLYFLDEDNIHENSEYFYLTMLAAESVSKRLAPDFISVKKMNELYGHSYPCMGCRAFLTPWINPSTGKYDMYGRGNLGVATVNLVDVALSCDGTENDFFDILEKRLELCKEVGILRYDKMKGIKANTAPILWQHGAISRLNPEDDIIKAIDERKFTVSIGYCGLHETVKYMKDESLSSENGIEFGIRIMKYLDNYKDRIKEETGLMFAIYGTPSESTAGWFSDKMKSRFGIIEGITDKGWITNSYHIDIQEHINAFDKLRIEQMFAKYSLGGTITYIEMPNMEKNVGAVIQLMQYMYENNIYAEMNTESDTCSTCGFGGVMQVHKDGLRWICPQCGESDQDKLSVVRRTCGYISETKWCASRMLDIINRVKHI